MKLHHYLISVLALLLASNVQQARADEDTPRLHLTTSTCSVNGHMLFPMVTARQPYFSVLIWYYNNKNNDSFWKEDPTLTIDGRPMTLKGIHGDKEIKSDPSWNDGFAHTLACIESDTVYCWVRWKDSFEVKYASMADDMALGGDYGRDNDFYIVVDVIFPTNAEGDKHTVSLKGHMERNRSDAGTVSAADFNGLTTLTTYKTNSPFGSVDAAADLSWTAPEQLTLTSPQFKKQNEWGIYQVNMDGEWSGTTNRGVLEVTKQYSNPDYQKADTKDITYWQYTSVDWADTTQTNGYTEHVCYKLTTSFSMVTYEDEAHGTVWGYPLTTNWVPLGGMEDYCSVKINTDGVCYMGLQGGVKIDHGSRISFKCLDHKRLKSVKLLDGNKNVLCEWNGNDKECLLTMSETIEFRYIDLTFDRYAYGWGIDFTQKADVKTGTLPCPTNLTAKGDEWAKTIKLSWEAKDRTEKNFSGRYVIWCDGDSIDQTTSLKDYDYYDFTVVPDKYDTEYTYTVSFEPTSWGYPAKMAKGLRTDVKTTLNRKLDLSDLTVTPNEDSNGYVLNWQLNSAPTTTDAKFDIYRIVVKSGMDVPKKEDFKVGQEDYLIGSVKLTSKSSNVKYSYNDKNVNSTDTYAYLVAIHVQEADFCTDPAIPSGGINSSSVTESVASCGEYTDKVVVRWDADIKELDMLKFIVYRHKIREGENYVNTMEEAQGELVWDSLTTVTGRGTDAEHTYTYEDKTVEPGSYYAYAVKAMPNGTAQQNTFQWCTGFARATATVHGHVTYQSRKYAVEGVRVLVDNTTETESEEQSGQMLQFKSLNISQGGGVHWNVSQNKMKNYFGLNSFSVQMYVSPDSVQSGNSLLDIDGRLGISLGDYTNDGYTLTVSAAGEEKTSALRIKPGQFTSITFTYDKGEGWIHLLCRDSIGCIASEKLLEGAHIDWPSASGRVAVGSLRDSTKTMLGYIDEVRFWSKPLSQAAVLKNYNHVLGGSEDGLVTYWTFDEGVSTMRAAYDYSMTGKVLNQNHATIVCGARDKYTLPTSDQFGLFGISDASGYYSVPGIPLIGQKTNYDVIPSKGAHEFIPNKTNITVSANALDFEKDFTDNSSFNVKGFVYYENTTYPVDSCMFYIDDSEDPVKDTNGRIVRSDADGAYTISVPIGEHYIRIERAGHLFRNEGRYPATDMHNFNDSISQLTFTDITKVVVAGRIVGGNTEREKPLGFGLSNANIGAATLTLVPSTDIRTAPLMNVVFNDTEGTFDDNPQRLDYETVQQDYLGGCSAYTPGGTATDSLKMIIIHTDPATGEFAVKLPPIPYTIEARMDHNDNVKFGDKEVLNASNPLRNDTVRTTIGGAEQTFCYNASYLPLWLSAPVISVKQKGNDVGAFGDAYVIQKKDDGVSRDTITVYTSADGQVTYNYDYPVFSFGGVYNFTISSYQPYVNYDSGEAVETREPTSGTVMVQNEMFAGSDTLAVGVLDSLGTYRYQFTGLLPNIDPSNGYTRLIDISVQIGEDVFTWNWDNATGGPLKGILLGAVQLGTSFVTKAPDEVINILRDPYGNNSTTTWAKGSSTSHSYKQNVNTSFGLSADQGGSGGIVYSFIYGAPGAMTESDGKYSGEYGLTAALDLSLIRDQVITWNTTTSQSISTSSDATHVGSMGDVFIGKSTAITFGDGKNVQFINNQQGGWRVGTTDAMVMGDSLTTDFVYSQFFIINQMIPELRDARNAMLQLVSKTEYDSDVLNYVNNGDEPVYKTWRTPDDPDFGAPNDTTQMKENEANRCVYGDSYAVFYPAGKDYSEDMVNDCNQQIQNWERLLALNEEDKVMAMTRYYNQGTSVSFETGSTTDKTSGQTHNFTEGVAFKHASNASLKFGYKGVTATTVYSELTGSWGIKIDRSRQPGYQYDSSTSESYTYSLRESANENSHQVTFYPSPGDYSNVCIQEGGQTSQPYEGADVSRYYEPGQHTFSVATKQIEVPTIHVDKYTVSNVPAGGVATFNLTLSNPTEAKIVKDLHFDLWVDYDKFGKMASVTLNGEQPTGNSFPITLVHSDDPASNYSAEMALQVKALTEDVIHIDSLHLFFSSNGQPAIRDDVYLSINFQPHAESIKLDVTPDLVNTATDSTLTLRAYDYNINSKILDAVKLQQRLEGSNEWTTLRTFVKENPVGSNESLLTETVDTVISMRSEIFYPDATYQFRAVTECSQQGEPIEGSSDIISVVKDITLPKPLYLPEPADGVLGLGDNISVTFDEDIFPSLRLADNFIVQSVLNTDSIAHEVALRMDGTATPVATSQTGLTLGNTSFTVCTWLKHNGQGGTVLRHGEGPDAFRINIDEQGYLVVYITDENGTAQPYRSNLVIPASQWVYLGLTYNVSSASLSAWYCSGDDDVTLMSGVPVGKKAASKGNIYLGENLTGAMHELSLYAAALDWYTGIKPQMYTGKSYSTPSIIGYWRLDEGHGDTSEDRARSRHMQLASASSWYLENENIAMQLDADSYAAIPLGSLSTSPSDSYLIEMWARTDSDAPNDSVQIFGIDDDKSLDLNVVKGQLQLVAKGIPVNATLTTIDWTADEWHHVALNVLRGGTSPAFNLIVDGTSVLNADASLVPALSGIYLNLGRRMKGAIDEVRLWHGTHTQADIVENIYNRLDPKTASGLVGYYPMEYTHYDDYHQRVYEFSLLNMADGADKQPAIIAMPETGALNSTTQTPGLKSAPHKSNLDIDYAVKDNVVTITLKHSAASLENCIVSTTLLRYYDLHDNIGNPITWTFRVKQNPLLWDVDKKEVTVPAGQGGSFTVRLTNYGVDDQQWEFPELPSWLQASQTSGLLPANGSTDITFTVSSSNAIGRYFATVSARTSLRQGSGGSNTLDTPLDISVIVEGEQPNWTAESYPESMTVVGQINIDGITSTDTGDMVGAFIYDDGQLKCVGKGQPKYNTQRDAYYVTMVVKGKRDMVGSPVSFRIYDASSGKTYPLVATTPAVTFAVDGTTGDYKNPVIWKNEAKLLQNEPLEEGWTSISLYLKPDTDDQHLFDILGNNILEVDVDKNTALTHSDGQWSATYSPIKPGQMMKVNLATADTLYVIGDEVDPADWPQTIAPMASTWIGVPTQAAMTLDEAFAGIEPEEGDMVKNDDTVSFFESGHWTGDVNAILPGSGYVYTSMSENAKTLVFPDKSETGLTSYHASRQGVAASRKYAHSMVAVCTLHGDYQETLGDDAVIEAFDQRGELRGRVTTLLRDSLRILLISGDDEGEPLLLTARLADGRQLVKMLPQGFRRDTHLGTLRAPFVIDDLTDGIELSTLNAQRSTISVYTTSGLPVYHGPAADFSRKRIITAEPLIVVETADDGHPKVYKLK
jgi:hypothetical protein